jgi:hypothetical protein
MTQRRFDLWLPSFAAGTWQRAQARRARQRRLTHILFLVCDHYEPRHGIRRPEQAFERVHTWHIEYAKLQARCRDAFGHAPLHSFFYPPHHGYEHLPGLAAMAYDGLGEVELHYHHHGDTEESLRRNLSEALAEYARWGLLLESGEHPRTRFGFVHGDWALNNSCGGQYCGVNDETRLLAELGCWGDFTMPSGNQCQTRKINSIYYGLSHPDEPKAHDTGIDARAGRPSPPGLFMMQGPLGINWQSPGRPRLENASLTTPNWGRPDRIRTWLNSNIHVQGRPEWLFVKLHTHGAIERDFDALFGDKAYELHRVLNEQYNDGRQYKLHYVTARQAYNIAKAAEAGEGGDPSQWIGFAVAAPATQFYTLPARHHLQRCTASHLRIDQIESGVETCLRTRVQGPVSTIRGAFTAIDIDGPGGKVSILPSAPSRFELVIRDGAQVEVAGAELLSDSVVLEGRRIQVAANGPFAVRCGATARAAIAEAVSPGSSFL